MFLCGVGLLGCVAPGFADVTVHGLTGTLLVPGLGVMPPGGARAGAHMVGNENDHEGSVKGVFAYSDDMEIGIMKRFVTGTGRSQMEPAFSAKFKLRPTTAIAAVFDPTESYKDSLMLLTGTPGNRVVLGVGANIAMSQNEKWAHFGRYQSDKQGNDPLFFLMGAHMNLDPETELTFDYTGSDLVFGIRHHFSDRVGLDFGYYTPNQINSGSRYCFGCAFGF
jgi:hypothetical protein